MKYGTHAQLLRVDSISKLDIGTIESTEFQTKIERAEQWGVGCLNNLTMLVFSVIRNIASVVTSAVILYVINPWLVLLAVISGLPFYFIQKKYGFQIYRLYHDRTDESRIMRDRNSFFNDKKKIVEVLLFNLGFRFRGDIEQANVSFDNKILNVFRRRSNVTFFYDFISVVCLLLAIGLVTSQTIKGDLLVGSLLLAFTTYRSFTAVVQDFYANITRMEDQSRYSKRWFDVFDTKPKILNSKNAIKPKWEIPPVIEFKDISFSYPETEKEVLKNISFKLSPGEKLAVVGENGAGKTTLIKLLCRVYDPTSGEILVDGINLKDIDLESWRNFLGVLFQDFSSFQMTVKEAIAISRPNDPINQEKVKYAAQMSGAVDFIENFPKKYDQLIWKGFQDGVELSKGQHQRMAVARIFYRDALISILDEPTSAIDAVAEEKIFEVLEKKMEGKTVILISHRFSTVKNADQIAVIEHGELKELGSHKELMAKKGRYEELYTMQASRYLESE
jgi:ABC-type multidrug transport system fused ATPase/permease subunit